MISRDSGFGDRPIVDSDGTLTRITIRLLPLPLPSPSLPSLTNINTYPYPIPLSVRIIFRGSCLQPSVFTFVCVCFVDMVAWSTAGIIGFDFPQSVLGTNIILFPALLGRIWSTSLCDVEMNGSNSTYSIHLPPIDVDDALQYTPLSSIVPLSTGRLKGIMPGLLQQYWLTTIWC